MPITYRSFAWQIASSGSINAPVPTHVAGDILIAHITNKGSAVVAAPAGWSKVFTTDRMQHLFVRTASSSEPSTYTFTLSFPSPPSPAGTTWTYITSSISAWNPGGASWGVDAVGMPAGTETQDVVQLPIYAGGLWPTKPNTKYIIFANPVSDSRVTMSPVTERWDQSVQPSSSYWHTAAGERNHSSLNHTGDDYIQYTGGGSNSALVLKLLLWYNNPPNTPTNLQRTGQATDTTPVFSAEVSDPDSGQQLKAQFEIETSTGTAIGTVDSDYRAGNGVVTAEYPTELVGGMYRVRAKSIDNEGAESSWTNWVDFVVNVQPDAPTITSPHPRPAYCFEWNFTDDNEGDTQSRSEGEIRMQDSASLIYNWDESTGDTYHYVSASQLPPGAYEWRVRTYDSYGEPGAWSSWQQFTLTTPERWGVVHI